jgi:hypothetical protein
VTLGYSGDHVMDSNGFLFLWHTLCYFIIDEFEKDAICLFTIVFTIPYRNRAK